jgi:hypothetical protein
MSKVINKEGYVIILPDNWNEKDHCPTWCPVCNFSMITYEDLRAYEKYECCYDCSITYAEGVKREDWKTGWRPGPEDLIKHEPRRRSKRINLEGMFD